MSKLLQIRNVPEDVHRQVKARAALAGMSMSEWLLQHIERILERPPRQELLARIRSREPVDAQPSPAELIRAERDQR